MLLLTCNSTLLICYHRLGILDRHFTMTSYGGKSLLSETTELGVNKGETWLKYSLNVPGEFVCRSEIPSTIFVLCLSEIKGLPQQYENT